MIDKVFIPQIIKVLPKIISLGLVKKSVDLLGNIGLCEEHIQDVFDDIHHANCRIPLLKRGLKMSQFGGDFDDSPIFQEAIKILLKEK